MKSAGIVNRLDDWLNPIVVKEMRQAVKSRAVLIVLTMFLLLQLGYLLVRLSYTNNRDAATLNLTAGRDAFQVLQLILLGTCLLLIPLYTGIRLAAEHSDTNVDLLFISSLRPRSIIAGKLQASILLLLLVFSAFAPFMTFTYLLRGIDLPSIFLVLGLNFLAVLLGTQVAIFLGAIPANWGMKVMLGLVGLGILGLLFGSALSLSSGLLFLGVGFRYDSVDFWLIAGAIVIGVVAIMGLLFTWSVAVVSPPSANRALPVRLYTLGGWLVTGGVALLLTRHFRQPAPLYIWMDLVTLLLCGQLLTAINEREQWGQRVRRTIPSSWLLRGPLFLLYSGAAGGILFTLILLVLTIAVPGYVLANWSELFVSPLGRMTLEASKENTLAALLIALYTFNYCLTAVVLRNTVLKRWVRPIYTWVVALLLWGLGFTLPYPILFLFMGDDFNVGRADPWCFISNPFASIEACIVRKRDDMHGFRFQCILFLSLWGTTLVLLCLPWIIRQINRFRPAKESLAA
jgi:hypothetical protein